MAKLYGQTTCFCQMADKFISFSCWKFQFQLGIYVTLKCECERCEFQKQGRKQGWQQHEQCLGNVDATFKLTNHKGFYMLNLLHKGQLPSVKHLGFEIPNQAIFTTSAFAFDSAYICTYYTCLSGTSFRVTSIDAWFTS